MKPIFNIEERALALWQNKSEEDGKHKAGTKF